MNGVVRFVSEIDFLRKYVIDGFSRYLENKWKSLTQVLEQINLCIAAKYYETKPNLRLSLYNRNNKFRINKETKVFKHAKGSIPLQVLYTSNRSNARYSYIMAQNSIVRC